MSDYLIPDPHLIEAILNSEMNFVDAASEFIDNGFGVSAGDARRFEIDFGIRPLSVKFSDDGRGVEDMNRMFTLGASQSQYSRDDIGRYGVGAKHAMGVFGTCARVDTVRDGIYHTYSVNWTALHKANQWPRRYTGKGVPADKAPEGLQDDGTCVTITRPVKGRRRLHIEDFCERLAHRYRPAFKQGRTIFVYHKEQFFNLAEVAEARLRLSKSKDDREHYAGEVEGRPFTVMATFSEEYSSRYNGVHIAFGHRFIRHETSLLKTRLPAQLYAEVELDASWKDCLNTHKTDLSRFKDELHTKLAELLEPWIKLLEKMTEEARLEKLQTLLSQKTIELFAYKGLQPGEFAPDDRDVLVSPEHDTDHEIKNAELSENLKAAKEGDQGDATKRKARAGGLTFKFVPLGLAPYRAGLENEKILVEINNELKPIAMAIVRPFKMNVVWIAISAAVSNYARINVDEFDAIMPGFEEFLHCSRDYPDEVEQRLLAWMIDQQPELNENELEVAV